jgi:formate dehydrogenase iron-sulfur subunit
MELNRRSFIKLTGAVTAACLLPTPTALAAPSTGKSANPKGMLSDLTKCIGCGWCQQACHEWNHLEGKGNCPDQDQDALSADTWTIADHKDVEQGGRSYRVYVKRQCMHCLDPACVSACPVGALQKLEEGPVTYDPSRCIGCRYCMVACPFGVPKFEWEAALPMICKCTFCVDRQQEGMEPACVAACPTGALLFGDRDALISEARSRIQNEPERYASHIYGESEIGGTSWLYLSPVPFQELGFPALKTEPVTELSEAIAVYGTPSMAVGVAALLGGVYYWFSRRQSAKAAGEIASNLEQEKKYEDDD